MGMLPNRAYHRTLATSPSLAAFIQLPRTWAVLETMQTAHPTRAADAIRQRLTAALAPSRLDLTDESALHAGHAGARPEGESHFRILIVAATFAGKSRLERQRMVFAALGDLMQTDIHALSMTALTPDEAAERR
jgi:BolA protein